MYKKIITSVLICVISTFMLISCATSPDDKKAQDDKAKPVSATMQNIQAFLGTGKTVDSPEPMPSSVSDALLPASAMELPLSSPEKLEPRFDIEVNRVYARSFFLSLVKDTPYNMVVHPDVKGLVTLNLKDVTINQVMQMVYDIYGYEYEQTASGYVVHPNKLQSRIFRVNYLNVKRQGQSETRVSAGQPSERSTSSGDDGSSTDSTSQSTLSASNIKTESNSDFWYELKVATEAIVGGGEGRSVVVSPQSGLIVVRAYPAELRKVQQYLQSAELIMQRQVILEAKVLEVELNDGFQQGINWSSLSDSGNTLIGQTGGGSLLSSPNNVSSISGNTGNLDPNNFSQVAGNAVSAFGGMFTLAVNSGNFKTFFEFLETQGNMQVLSSPRVSTVNNQKAVIKVGSDEFFVTDISTTTTSGVATTTTPDVTLTPFFSGIALDVTPQIDEKGSVILHIHPTISEVVDQEKTIAVAGQVLSLPLAFSQVRESDSIVHAKNGQIIVIGGLMKNKIIEKESATPILSSIPLLGELFKHKQDESVKSELVILLRPIVIDHDAVWSDVIGESSNRVQQIYHDYGRN